MSQTKKSLHRVPADGQTTPKTAIVAESVPSQGRVFAEIVAVGPLASAVTLELFANTTMTRDSGPMVTRSDCLHVLVDAVDRARSGNLKDVEGMLAVQAITLNTVFNTLAHRAASNLDGRLSTAEAYLRLALKAQNQSRMTIETLANIKNPPTVFAKQANIAHQQQVNMGVPVSGTCPHARESNGGLLSFEDTQVGTCPHARESNKQSEPSKLLEASHGKRLEPGAQGATGGTHQGLEPLAAVHRAAHRRR